MLKSITFKKDWRCFKAGDQIDLRPGINLLVGDQGSGKSSILQILRDVAITGDKRMRDMVELKPSGVRLPVAYYDTEKNNPRILPSMQENLGIFQVQAHFLSHGQVMLPVLDAMPRKGLLLVDEPDTALSPRSVLDLLKLLRNREALGMQLLVACHNPWLIEALDEVLSLEHRRWIKSAEFLSMHRTRPRADKTKPARGGASRKKGPRR